MSEVILRPNIWRPGAGFEILREGFDRKTKRLLDDVWNDYILAMAGSFSDFIELKYKNHLFGATAYTAPTPVYFALWTSALDDTSVGNTAGEASSGSYDRVSVTNNTTNFATVTGNTAKTNSTDITFPTATANWSSGSNMTYMGVFDANAKTSGDNLLVWADLTTAKPVNNGDTAKFATGDFSVQLT